MFPVLQPSMTDLESRADGNGDADSIIVEQIQPFKKNETKIANGTASMPMPPVLNHIRCYFLSYRRHRNFRRSCLILWACAVAMSVWANYSAWTGQTLEESLNIKMHSPVDICFITAQFASSEENLDNLVNLREESPMLFTEEWKDYFHFYAFTNHKDWIIKASASNEPENSENNSKGGSNDENNGWTILLQEFPPDTFQRFITQSRWPKFQGFRHEKIQETCDVVFYMDGTVLPVGSPFKFQDEARRILNSKVQLSQELHPHQNDDGGGIIGEMNRCRVKKKDLPSNLDKSMKWLESQPDFTNNCTMYQNTFFGYGVNSPSFRKAADFAWGHFSLEQDSWRDQPLWCYTMHHFGIKPLVIPDNILEYQGQRRNKKKHTYGEEATNNAKVWYENKGKSPNEAGKTGNDKKNSPDAKSA